MRSRLARWCDLQVSYFSVIIKCSSRVSFKFDTSSFELTLTFSDPEINDECISVCRLDYLTCRQNCSSPSCESACLVVYTGYSKKVLWNLIEIQSATVLVPAAPSVPPAASTVQARDANHLHRLDTEVRWRLNHLDFCEVKIFGDILLG